MLQYWVNFVRTGNPNGGGLPSWPSFDEIARKYLLFVGADPAVKEGLRRQACDLFIDNLRRITGQGGLP